MSSRSNCTAAPLATDAGQPQGCSPRPLSGVEEFVPLLDDEVIFIRPLMPIGDIGGARRQRSAVPEIAFLDAALRRTLPRLAQVPEAVLLRRHHLLDVGGGR